jgi:hypothetical protein
MPAKLRVRLHGGDDLLQRQNPAAPATTEASEQSRSRTGKLELSKSAASHRASRTRSFDSSQPELL